MFLGLHEDVPGMILLNKKVCNMKSRILRKRTDDTATKWSDLKHSR